MYIHEAEINGYVRLYVSNIKYLLYRPNHKLQIILGKNGSGKSSLLKELIPNVDNLKEEYDNDGYKKIVYKHYGDTITVGYNRDNNRHSFLVNGEEKNTSGLMKVQATLIEEYLSIDKYKHGLITGSIKLTMMSPNERKKWFTEILSYIDYSYALNIYNKAKDRVKELKSFIKLIQSKLINMDNDINHEIDGKLKSIEDDIKALKNYKNSLTSEIKDYKDINVDKYLDAIDVLTNDLALIIDKLKDKDISNIDDKIVYLANMIKVLESNKVELSKKINNIESLKISEDDTSIKIKDEIDVIKNKISAIEKMNVYNIDLSKVDYIYRALDSKLTYITDIVNGLIELDGLADIVDNIEKLIEEERLLNNQLNDINNKIKLIEDELSKYKDSDNDFVKCPKCNHEFIPGYDPNKIRLLEDRLSTYKNTSLEVSRRLSELKNMLGIYNTYTKYLERLQGLLDGYLSPLYIYLYKNSNRLTDKNISTIVNKMHVDIKHMLSIKNLYNRLQELENKLIILEKVKDDRVAMLFQKLKEYKDEYINTIKKINDYKEKLEKYKNINNYVKKARDIYNKLDRLLLKNRLVINNEVNKHKTLTIVRIIEEVDNLIDMLNKEITKHKSLKDQYKVLEKELEDYKKRLKATTLLVHILSPNKGIIGKTVTNIINDIIERMNDIISNIWTYDLRLDYVNMDDSDLNFRFPVKVNNRIISDVSKGSSSMREVFDLAFRIVAMEYLNMLEEYPLILDEFGSTMDTVHRIKAYDYIEELSKSYFSQIFIVSHFESMYARFVNCDVIVLSNDNVGYNGVYNEVVKMR